MELGDRMKFYESAVGNVLMPRCPVIIRIDGRSFHTFTKGFEKPYDLILAECMKNTLRGLCEQIQGAALGYWQSDEISIMLVDYRNLESQQWFGGTVQKIVSIASSIATLEFNKSLYSIRGHEILNQCGRIKADCSNLGYSEAEKAELAKDIDNGRVRIELLGDKQFKACFDARVFNVPVDDVGNYFHWRVRDAIRNSMSGLAQAHFSHKELHKVNFQQMGKMLFDQKGIDWLALPREQQQGCLCVPREMGKWDIVSDFHDVREVAWWLSEPQNAFITDGVLNGNEYAKKFGN
jgi:tRNA(His) guanylyltransferase